MFCCFYVPYSYGELTDSDKAIDDIIMSHPTALKFFFFRKLARKCGIQDSDDGRQVPFIRIDGNFELATKFNGRIRSDIRAQLRWI
ncbi:hypothetical protein RB195_020331 [Necator americanus]|uniref:Thioredoxin-like fold domain-containing protein n=1 Tax=Necator americanus TaxID=51031 RepID=A0ABR1CIA2_NECAM